MVEDPNSTVEKIGQLISQDPALTVRVLSIANSPFYGFSSEVSTISRAVTVLGTRQIRDIVMSMAATKAFDGIPNDLISMDDFWYHSIYCGLLAHELGGCLGRVEREAIFVAGLLHDIGHLIMFSKLPDLTHEAILRTLQVENPLSLHEAEREVIGVDHTEIGGELARVWKLPEHIYACIAYHHNPAAAPYHQQEVAVIHIANHIASLPYSTGITEEDMKGIVPACWEITGLSHADIAPAADAAQAKIAEVKNLYLS